MNREDIKIITFIWLPLIYLKVWFFNRKYNSYKNILQLYTGEITEIYGFFIDYWKNFTKWINLLNLNFFLNCRILINAHFYLVFCVITLRLVSISISTAIIASVIVIPVWITITICMTVSHSISIVTREINIIYYNSHILKFSVFI